MHQFFSAPQVVRLALVAELSKPHSSKIHHKSKHVGGIQHVRPYAGEQMLTSRFQLESKGQLPPQRLVDYEGAGKALEDVESISWAVDETTGFVRLSFHCCPSILLVPLQLSMISRWTKNAIETILKLTTWPILQMHPPV